jgi:hypothetical protein
VRGIYIFKGRNMLVAEKFIRLNKNREDMLCRQMEIGMMKHVI